MKITSFEEYERILRSTYLYSPIDINIGFYGLCSYQHDAWEYVFSSIRKYYPDAPIVLFDDGTNTPIAYTYTNDEVKILLKDFKNINIDQTHIFPYKIEEYKNNIYKRRMVC